LLFKITNCFTFYFLSFQKSYTTSDDAGIEDEREDLATTDIIKGVGSHTSDSSRSIHEAHKIACELLSTEEQYVSVLSLIDQVSEMDFPFYILINFHENVASTLPPQKKFFE